MLPVLSLAALALVLAPSLQDAQNSSIQKEKNVLGNMAKSFIDSLTAPTRIDAFLCWRKRDQIRLMRAFFSDLYLALYDFPVGSISWGVPEHQLFLLDLRCEGAYEVLRMAEELSLFKQPFRWLLLGSSPFLDDFYFGVDSNVYTAEELEGGGTEIYQIRAIYKYSASSKGLAGNFVGTWSNGRFIDYKELVVGTMRSDIHGTLINVSYVITNPDTLNHLDDYRDVHIDAITKLNYFLSNYLIDYVNGSRRFNVQRTWGYKNSTTGIYSGMIGDLQLGYAELGGTPCFFLQDRIAVIDFFAPTTPTFMKFIFRAPPLSYVTNVFTLPFDTLVWYCCFAMVAVILAVICAIVEWEWRDPVFRRKNEDVRATLRPGLLDVFMMEVGAITQQGTDVEPNSISGRIATILTFLVLMFLYTAYSANIVALLQSTTDSLNTLEDLLKSRIKLGVEDIVYAHHYFETATEPTRRAIFEQKVAPPGQKPNFMTVEEGIRRMQQEFFGFHVELTTGYKVVAEIFQESEKCALREIEYVNLIEPWLSMRKNSAYSEILKVGMRKFMEYGIQRREIKRIYTKKPPCLTGGSQFGSAGLIDCYAAFLIFGIGVGAAVLMLVLELVLRRWSHRRALMTANKNGLAGGKSGMNANTHSPVADVSWNGSYNIGYAT